MRFLPKNSVVTPQIWKFKSCVKTRSDFSLKKCLPVGSPDAKLYNLSLKNWHQLIKEQQKKNEHINGKFICITVEIQVQMSAHFEVMSSEKILITHCTLLQASSKKSTDLFFPLPAQCDKNQRN